MPRILVNLDEEKLKAADAAARRLGVSRSEVVRRAVTAFTNPGPREETMEERRTRMMAAYDRMQAAGRRILAANPEWDPVALIRAARDGKIRL